MIQQRVGEIFGRSQSKIPFQPVPVITLGTAIVTGEDPIGELPGFSDAPYLPLEPQPSSLALITKSSISKDTAYWTSTSFVLYSQILLHQSSS